MDDSAGGHEYEQPPLAELEGLGRALAAGLSGGLTVHAGGQASTLPAEVHRALVRLTGAMSAAEPITFTPSGRTLSLQEAADRLGVPYAAIGELVQGGRLPVEYAGSRPRVRSRDLESYRVRRREARYAAVLATAVDLADESDVDDTTLRLVEARRVVAGRRASRRRQGLEG